MRSAWASSRASPGWCWRSPWPWASGPSTRWAEEKAMTALWILEAYVALGAVSALIILVRRGGGAFQARVSQALAALVLWPFVLPVALVPGQAAGCTVTEGRSERARRLDEVAGRLEECWRQASVESTWAAEQGREHQVLDRFILRLRSQQRRIEEMEAALAAAP